MHTLRKKADGCEVVVQERRLIASPDSSYLAASTDGFVSVLGTEGGEGLLEIKCPVSRKTVKDLAASRKNVYLITGQDGILSLKRTHAYFTQVQFQMAVTGRLWTNFVVFTVPDEGKEDGDIIVERIPFSPVFWKKKLLHAVKTVIFHCFGITDPACAVWYPFARSVMALHYK